MSEQTDKPESIRELVKHLYEKWKNQPELIDDIRNLTEEDFIIKINKHFGQSIFNEYVVKSTDIYLNCKELGLIETETSTDYIFKELYNYTKNKLMAQTEDTKESNHTEVLSNELDGLHALDWLQLKDKYPLAIDALEEWFITRVDVPEAEVIIEQYTILLTNGSSGMYLNPRDLYDFFDYMDIRPFIAPEEKFPQLKFLIQSKKSIKKFDTIYDDRTSAEIQMFIQTFFFVEATLEHQISKSK